MSLSAESQSAPRTNVRIPGPASRAVFWRDLVASARENSPLILFALLFAFGPLYAYTHAAIPVAPFHDILPTYLGFALVAPAMAFAAFAVWFLYNKRIKKVPNFQAEAWRRLKTDFLARERLMLALPVLALWPVVASSFTYMKSVIPLLHPFYLDPALHHWDQVLHFGVDPWRILQPVLGYTWITFAINFVYALWFFVLQATLVLQAASTGDRKRRMQFLLSMSLSWALIGSLVATFLSSAGPCYYGLVVDGPNPYTPLLDYLHGVVQNLTVGGFGLEAHLPLTSQMLQDMLWQSYSTSDFGMVRGISAAPSMHLASTWLIARLAWSIGGKARFFGAAFLGFIFIGSIHLGWHYALDGYLAMAGAWVLWRVVGWLLDRPAVEALLWPARADSRAAFAD
jgi:hypothetical protein